MSAEEGGGEAPCVRPPVCLFPAPATPPTPASVIACAKSCCLALGGRNVGRLLGALPGVLPSNFRVTLASYPLWSEILFL